MATCAKIRCSSVDKHISKWSLPTIAKEARRRGKYLPTVRFLPYFRDKLNFLTVRLDREFTTSLKTMQFALKNRMPMASSASKATRVAPVTVARMSVATPARSMFFSRPTSSRGARTIVAQATSRDVSVDASKSEVKGQSSRLNFKKGDPSNYALGILGDLHMDPRDLGHSFEGRDHVKAVLANEENTFVVGEWRNRAMKLICSIGHRYLMPFHVLRYWYLRLSSQVSLGDVGESKDCTQTKQLYAGTTECFKLVREFLDGFGQPYNVVGGNHDLEVRGEE